MFLGLLAWSGCPAPTDALTAADDCLWPVMRANRPEIPVTRQSEHLAQPTSRPRPWYSLARPRKTWTWTHLKVMSIRMVDVQLYARIKYPKTNITNLLNSFINLLQS